MPLQLPLLSLRCRAGALIRYIKRPRVSAPVPVWLGPWRRLVGCRATLAVGGNVSAPATRDLVRVQPAHPAPDIEPRGTFHRGPFNGLDAFQQFPGSNLCKASTIQSIVTHQWNKDSFMNARMAAAKRCSGKDVAQEASERQGGIFPDAESSLLVLVVLAIRK